MSAENVQLEAIPSPKQEDSFLKGVKDCIPTLLGYLSIGLAAGVVQKTAGLSIAEIALISLILYAGSAQFIAAGMIAVSSSPAAIIITIFIVNLRHILLSAALSPYFRHLSPLRNMLVGSLLTDETFGVAINQALNKQQISEKWMHGLNLTAYLNWFLANVAGAFLAQWISDPDQFGLQFALPAMFIGILVISMIDRNKIKLDLVVAILAVIIAVGSSFLFSSSVGVIIATVIASTIGMVFEKWK
ncbi:MULTISPECIES: AzlC family ABC transporter permease [Paenibacillus]|jgi:4-azaleucine resistance transporter AzlC|uniref:Branched-chain amino acid ABC transporter permease n=2 Tax=Paenibacillus odorifer TaxID=189426 RepID=A0A1R0YYN9_9BACL|nr:MULTISPECIES: AzlC family ABC transporter permease [Paenibacillus]AIQ76013.1 branched-chain amino acid permease [Paenibacillus odorifer]AWV35313.1 branched-chain amino acid ABC transporter permease [Paenibacillus odorifer]ETT56489.1 AzlC family protein [Paenibacillus sp. FSL H8-237]MEC0134877.1 AzlC family ABC transporter permease [Paenibacillus odorifer]MEC0221487.1 AzlC family ABC transporter permease [Paenibacillus odorifer]